MATDIEAKEEKVSKLFSPDFVFMIPIYQRPLSWERENFEQLIDDILESSNDKESQYFLGSIILQETQGDGNRYEIVDGQQRISSLAILMAVMRDMTENSSLRDKLLSYLFQTKDEYKNIPEEMRIIPWKDLKPIFKDYIYKQNGTADYYSLMNKGQIKYRDWQDPLYHLYEAIDVFREKISGLVESGEDLGNFVKYLLNRVYLVCIKTATFSSAYRLFNVLNARGLSLSTSDLLKSENLGEIADASERDHYAEVWRELENKLGREELENVIIHVRTMLLKERARVAIYDEYRKLIFQKGIIQRGKQFIEHLDKVAGLYLDKVIEGETSLGGSEKNEYKYIVGLLRRHVPFNDWVPPLLAFERKYASDGHALSFVLQLEKKVILEWAAGFSAQERITSLNRILKLVEQESDAESVIHQVLNYKGEETAVGRKARFLEYGEKNKIQEMFRDKLNDNQFYNIYGGKLARYLLLRIDLNELELENFPGYPGSITVEHILPQTPKVGSEWMTLFSDEQRKDFTNRLGNLVLLSGSKNSKAQNYEFAEKKEAYFSGKCTAFRITQEINALQNWSPKEFEERHLRLINKAVSIFLNYQV